MNFIRAREARLNPFRSQIRKSIVIAVGILLACIGSRGMSRAEINPRYYEGDWLSFTSVRHVSSVAATPDFLYFGTLGGVARYDRNLARWLPAFTTAEGLPSNVIERLAFDPLTDYLYAETPNGAARYHRVLAEWRSVAEFPESLTQSFLPIDLMAHDLPFGYDALDQGLLTDPYLRSYPVQGGLEDSWGILWVATWGQFVWMRPFGSFELEPQKWGPYHDNVEAIFLDGETMYFGGTNYYGTEGALSIYDRAAAKWTYIESRFTKEFASDRIRDIVGAGRGRYLWMATDDGVVRYDRRRAAFRSYGRREGLSDERIESLCLDGDILWIGTETGVDGMYIPRDSIFSATTDAVDNALVYAIDATGDEVWLGTDRGLYRLAKPVPLWKRYSTGTGPLSGRVRALRHDGRYLYVGSDRGIAVVDLRGSKEIQIYERPTALPDDNIFDLAVTDSILWVATPSGLIRFVPATSEQRVLTTDDGLVDMQVQAIAVEGPYLWLGTPAGVSRFRWDNPFRID